MIYKLQVLIIYIPEPLPNGTVDEFEYTGINIDNTSTNEEIDKQVKLQEEQEGSLIWSRQATLLLIGECKDRIERIDSGKLRKNKAFEEISKELHTAGYSFSSEQCSGRMKTITRAYKQVKDHNAKSGNDRKSYIYETELDEIYSSRLNIEPKFVASTSQSEEHAKRPGVNDRKQETEKRSNSDTESEGNHSVCKVKKNPGICCYFIFGECYKIPK